MRKIPSFLFMALLCSMVIPLSLFANSEVVDLQFEIARFKELSRIDDINNQHQDWNSHSRLPFDHGDYANSLVAPQHTFHQNRIVRKSDLPDHKK